MNDSRLAVLAQMAREVEELELAAAEPIRIAPAVRAGADRSGVLASLGPLAALAACVAIAGVIVVWPNGAAPAAKPLQGPAVTIARPHLPSIPKSTPAKSVVPLPAKIQPVADESALVLAIVESPDGDVQCVSWTRHDPSSVVGPALTPADLARQICRADCVAGPHWLLAAKVSGPTRLLPSRDEDVQALAQCIIGEHAERCDGGPTLLAGGSAQCIPTGMRVVVERRSLASP